MKIEIIVFGIILLFVGLSVSPGLNNNIVKASYKNNIVELKIQTCGIEGYDEKIVEISREKCKNLENYLDSFQERLNQTKTREEAIQVYKDAIIELDKYGLLPIGMSVETVQKLVTESQLDPNVEKLMELLKKSPLDLGLNNVLCLLAMKSVSPGNDVTFGFLTIPSVILFMICMGGLFHFNNLELAMLVAIPLLLTALVGIPSLIFNYFSPILLWSIVVINSVYEGTSIGLKGVQSINGLNYLIGYKGIRIWIPVGGYDDNSFYLGQALAVL